MQRLSGRLCQVLRFRCTGHTPSIGFLSWGGLQLLPLPLQPLITVGVAGVKPLVQTGKPRPRPLD